MNCMDVRRALLADPGRVAPGEDAHLLACDSCRRFAAEVAVREGLIDHALHVPLPPGFERRLLELRRRRPIGRQRGAMPGSSGADPGRPRAAAVAGPAKS